MKLHWQILIALIAAAIVGSLVPAEGWWIDAFDLIGTFFLNALKMLIVPLIVSSIIVGVMGLPGERELGRLGGKTLAYYVVTSLCAILIGLFFVNLSLIHI